MTNSIRNKLGQLIMMDFRYWGEDSEQNPLPFTKSNQTVCKLFKEYNLSGFILFKENIQDNKQTISLLRDLQSNSITPLFFAIDQEGGRVNRLKQGTSGCGNMALAATNNPENSYQMAKIIGQELYSLGINTNFAPVIDVNSNSKNPIVGVRSYSDDPKTIVKYANKAIQGFTKSKIIDCVKHFPGHGDTALDSHLGNVTINKTIDDLEKVELYPFKKLANKYSMVMSAHISVPALDNTKYKSISTGEELYIPATLSYEIITKLLKKHIGFKGLVVSDAMDMKAIATHFGQIQATKLAILAGIDIVLMPVRVWNEKDTYRLEKLFIELEKEYLSNKEFAKTVDKAYTKVIKFKKDYQLDQKPIFTFSKDKQIDFANSVVNSQEHQQIALNIAKQSTTIVKNSGLLPYQLKNQDNIVIIDSDMHRLDDFKNSLISLTKHKFTNLNITTLHLDNTNIETAIRNSNITILVSANLRKYSKKYSYITSISADKIINIAAITPYDINYISNIKNYVCIYGATSVDQTNYTRTTLEINILSGLMTIFSNKDNRIAGKLPVIL